VFEDQRSKLRIVLQNFDHLNEFLVLRGQEHLKNSVSLVKIVASAFTSQLQILLPQILLPVLVVTGVLLLNNLCIGVHIVNRVLN